jgi:hypothetical protein
VGRIPESAWTGSELLAWSRTSNAGAGGDTGHRYDPSTDEWTPIEALAPDRGIEYGSAAWTGSELIVYGLSVADETRSVANAWSPATGSWRVLPDPPTRPVDWYEGTLGSQSLVWNDATGLLVVWPTHGGEYGVDKGGNPGPIPLLTFDPATGAWTELALASLGYHPDLTSIGRFVLRPDPSNPIVFAFDDPVGVETTIRALGPGGLPGQLADGRVWTVWDDPAEGLCVIVGEQDLGCDTEGPVLSPGADPATPRHAHVGASRPVLWYAYLPPGSIGAWVRGGGQADRQVSVDESARFWGAVVPPAGDDFTVVYYDGGGNEIATFPLGTSFG